MLPPHRGREPLSGAVSARHIAGRCGDRTRAGVPGARGAGRRGILERGGALTPWWRVIPPTQQPRGGGACGRVSSIRRIIIWGMSSTA